MPESAAAPTITDPVTWGRHGWSSGEPLMDVGRHGYVQDEYFLEATATRYRLAPQRPACAWEAPPSRRLRHV